MISQTEQKKQFRRKFRLTRYYAVLGDENGIVDEPSSPGMVRVRYTSANALGQPTVVRFRAAMKKESGTKIVIEFDDEDQLAVTKPHFGGMLADGVNPVGNNAADDYVSEFITLLRLSVLHSHPVSTTGNSMLVTVMDFVYIRDGVLHWFLGGDGTQAPIDLTSYIPASAGMQCLASLFVATDDTLEIQTSTPILVSDPFSLTDVQECLDASSADSIPVWSWRLYNGQTGVRAGDLAAGGDDFLDLRQFINIPSSGGGVTSVTGTPPIASSGGTTPAISLGAIPEKIILTSGQNRAHLQLILYGSTQPMITASLYGD